MFFCRWFCFTATLFIAGGQLSATTLEAMTLESLTQHSDLVVQVRIGNSTVSNLDQQPHTLVEAEIEEVLHGSPLTDPVQVAIPGGVAPHSAIPVEVMVAGAPRLLRGTRAILFLQEVPGHGGLYRLVGLSQGVFYLDEGGTAVAQGTESARPAVADLKARIRAATEVAR